MQETHKSFEEIIARMREGAEPSQPPETEASQPETETPIERYIRQYSSLITDGGIDYQLRISKQDGSLLVTHLDSGITYIFRLGARSHKFVSRSGQKAAMSDSVERSMFEHVVQEVEARMKRIEQDELNEAQEDALN